MYSLYKYHEILTMEEALRDEFASINPCKDIAILPPIIRRYNGRQVLAFLVIPQPENNHHHLAVFRPIGAIFRKLKSKKIVKLVSCETEEFAPKYHDFSYEYYDLESNPNFWPNRTPDNEEQYRVSLEKLLKIVQTMHFGAYRKKLYQEYLDSIYSMFSEEYLYYYDALANNPITPLTDEILYQRELAKKEHEIKMQKMREKFLSDTSYAKQKFIQDMKEHMQFFIRKEILPTLKNKTGYTRIDFYNFAGKLYKDILTDDDKYISCYDATLTAKALENNLDEVKESLKVSLIKTYAKACVKPSSTDDAINEVCDEIVKFMTTMLHQEITKTVSQKSKDLVQTTMIKIDRMLGRIPNAPIKEEIERIYHAVQDDYFNGLDEKEMSNVYLGCMLTEIVI